MTKKYEKFEEWMVGKTVTWDGEEGVVTKGFEDNCVWVLWEDGGELWIEVDSLEFLDEAPSQPDEDKPIPWQVGQVVWDVVYGKGVVTRVEDAILFPVKVEFDDGGYEQYTLQGTEGNGTRTLFFSEPIIIADTMPPEKPFVPKLKEGDKVFISFGGKARLWFVEVVQEDETTLTFKLEGDEFSSTHFKKDIRVFVCTEEIKWEA